MPTKSRVAVAFLTCTVFANCASACIFNSEESVRERIARDKVVQRQMAQALAMDADTIVIAQAGSDGPNRSKTFIVDQVLKGSIVAGQELVARWVRLNDSDFCGWARSKEFLNTLTFEGYEYLVYSIRGVLLRVTETERDSSYISLHDEVAAIEPVLRSQHGASRVMRNPPLWLIYRRVNGVRMGELNAASRRPAGEGLR